VEPPPPPPPPPPPLPLQSRFPQHPFLPLTSTQFWPCGQYPPPMQHWLPPGAQPFSQHSRPEPHALPVRQQVSSGATHVPSVQHALAGSGQQRPETTHIVINQA
jgi:hypothetical protein